MALFRMATTLAMTATTSGQTHSLSGRTRQFIEDSRQYQKRENTDGDPVRMVCVMGSVRIAT